MSDHIFLIFNVEIRERIEIVNTIHLHRLLSGSLNLGQAALLSRSQTFVVDSKIRAALSESETHCALIRGRLLPLTPSDTLITVIMERNIIKMYLPRQAGRSYSMCIMCGTFNFLAVKLFRGQQTEQKLAHCWRCFFG